MYVLENVKKYIYIPASIM